MATSRIVYTDYRVYFHRTTSDLARFSHGRIFRARTHPRTNFGTSFGCGTKCNWAMSGTWKSYSVSLLDGLLASSLKFSCTSFLNWDLLTSLMPFQNPCSIHVASWLMWCTWLLRFALATAIALALYRRDRSVYTTRRALPSFETISSISVPSTKPVFLSKFSRSSELDNYCHFCNRLSAFSSSRPPTELLSVSSFYSREWGLMYDSSATSAKACDTCMCHAPQKLMEMDHSTSQWGSRLGDKFSISNSARTNLPAPPPISRRGKNNAFVKVAIEQVLPAVVRLDTDRPVYEPRDGDVLIGQGLRNAGNHLFQFWLQHNEEHSHPKFSREKSQGTGLIVDGQQGIIVTNSHVVKDADHVQVTLTGGKILEGKVLAIDDVSDLALVKVSNGAEQLPVAPLGDSNTVELGDWVIAVGNPYGLHNTISLGIISNLQRTAAEVGLSDKCMSLFQTDCAINPGSSGGPLLNEFGEVIGINTAIRADADGIAFAIPMNNVMSAVQILWQGRCVQHPFLGIEMVCQQSPGCQGVKVVKISNGSAAAEANLKVGDIIVEVNSEALYGCSQLAKIVQTSSIGQVLSLRLWRENGYLELSVKIQGRRYGMF